MASGSSKNAMSEFSSHFTSGSQPENHFQTHNSPGIEACRCIFSSIPEPPVAVSFKDRSR